MNQKRRIPLADLKAQYRAIGPEIETAMRAVIDTTAFVRGAPVRDFESAFSAYCGTAAAVGTGNGTDAIYLALRALGIGPGDQVITVSNTFIATVEGIVLAGAAPVFVDVREDTLLMDPELIEAAITPRVRALMPVHLYGNPCDMTRICAVAKRHNLKVIEDAAQAHGAEWRGRRAGSLGDVACFSFYPGKNLGAYGDGGAVTSDDSALIQTIRRTADHGRLDRYTHDMIGVNSRLDTLQAAVLAVKLAHLDEWNVRRRAVAAAYRAAFEGTAVRPLAVDPEALPVYHLYVVRVPAERRDSVVAALNAREIGATVHYPIPVHLQPAMVGAGRPAALPVTERTAHEIISLPAYPEMTESDVTFVAETVIGALADRGRRASA